MIGCLFAYILSTGSSCSHDPLCVKIILGFSHILTLVNVAFGHDGDIGVHQTNRLCHVDCGTCSV